MPSRSTGSNAAAVREKLFLLSIVTLAVAQLIAFWMLCSHQVRQAHARDATMQVAPTAAGSQRRDPSAGLAGTHDPAQLDAPAGRPTPASFTLH